MGLVNVAKVSWSRKVSAEETGKRAVEYGEGMEKPALLNGVAGKASKMNEPKLIAVDFKFERESVCKQLSVKGKYT